MVETVKGTPKSRLITLGLKSLKTFFDKKGDKDIRTLGQDVKDQIDKIYSQVYTAVVKNRDYENFSKLNEIASRKTLSGIRNRSYDKGYLDPNIGQEAITMTQQKPYSLKKPNITYIDRQGDLLPKKINAYKTIVDEIIKKRGYVKKLNKQTGVEEEFLAAGPNEFSFAQVMPILKERFPKIFADFPITESFTKSGSLNTNVGFNRAGHQTFNKYIKSQVVLPKLLQNKNAYEATLVGKVFDKYRPNERPSRITDDIDRQFMFDLFRGRPNEFRTGNMQQDVDMFFHFLNDVNYFNPVSENFYLRTDPDFKGYKAYREKQKTMEKGTQLSHTLHTVIPDPFFEVRMFDDLPTVQAMKTAKFDTPNKYMSDVVPFGTTDPVDLTLLPSKTNLYLQPELEAKYYNALNKPLDQRDGRELARIEQEMIDNKITTRITDPITGEDNLLGYIRSEKDPVTGYADGGLVSVEEMLEYDNG